MLGSGNRILMSIEFGKLVTVSTMHVKALLPEEDNGIAAVSIVIVEKLLEAIGCGRSSPF
jgi:hypothetical protein